jgi:hypothetical protein
LELVCGEVALLDFTFFLYCVPKFFNNHWRLSSCHSATPIAFSPPMPTEACGSHSKPQLRPGLLYTNSISCCKLSGVGLPAGQTQVPSKMMPKHDLSCGLLPGAPCSPSSGSLDVMVSSMSTLEPCEWLLPRVFSRLQGALWAH